MHYNNKISNFASMSAFISVLFMSKIMLCYNYKYIGYCVLDCAKNSY